MSALQESRRELMVQLEGLMRLLKVRPSPVPTRFMCDKKNILQWCTNTTIVLNLLFCRISQVLSELIQFTRLGF